MLDNTGFYQFSGSYYLDTNATAITEFRELPGILMDTQTGAETNLQLRGSLGPVGLALGGTLYATNGAALLTSSTAGMLWTATNNAGRGTWSNAPTFTASATNSLGTVEIQGTNVVALTHGHEHQLLAGCERDLAGTNQGNGKASILISAGAGTGGDQYSGGSMVLEEHHGTGAITNKSAQIAANNVLSNLQTMAAFYFTNATTAAGLSNSVMESAQRIYGFTNSIFQLYTIGNGIVLTNSDTGFGLTMEADDIWYSYLDATGPKTLYTGTSVTNAAGVMSSNSTRSILVSSNFLQSLNGAQLTNVWLSNVQTNAALTNAMQGTGFTTNGSAILQSATNYANAVTNSTIARTNGTEFLARTKSRLLGLASWCVRTDLVGSP